MKTSYYDYPKLYKQYAKKRLVAGLKKRDYPLIPLSFNDTIIQVGYGYKQRRVWCTDYNQISGFGLAKDKEVTNDFLNNGNIPAPVSIPVANEKEFKEALLKIDFPLVLKPAKGTHGGKGVKVNILSKAEAMAAFKEVMELTETIIVENYLEGDDHRVLVINYEAVAVLQRIPANVKGDGKSTVKELIETENERRENLPHEQKASLLPIPMDQTTGETLKKIKMSYDSIPEQNQMVKLRFNSNVCTGGETVGVTDKIHPENKKLCEKAARLMGLKIAGVDVISTDISKPMNANDAKIIEVNTRPGIIMHTVPGSGEPIDTVSIFVDKVFPKPEDMWIPITLSGQKVKNSSEVKKHLANEPKSIQRYRRPDSREIEIVNNPTDQLVTYLMDPLTVAVEIF
ncbi:ATP-grasp domain-containing protein [Patescibacteria group bacterium]